jgi:hypothetical protein
MASQATVTAMMARVARESGQPVLPVPMSAGLWIVAGAIVAGWLGLAASHLSDDYRVTHAQGVWIAAVQAAGAGELYAPIFDGERYAGTRYLPLPILLNAVASGAVGDPLIGGKLLAAILMVTLFVLVVWVLRHFSCPWPLAAALAASVVATEAGLQAATTIGGDLLPVVLQVAALAVSLNRPNWPSMVAAGGLAGLAIASKLTGLWGALAVMTWLAARRQWRSAALFAVAGVGTATVILGAVQLLTRGRLLEHLLAFSVAGVYGAHSLVRAPNQVLYNLRGYATGAVVLLPLAALGALLSTGWRRLSIIHLALGYALLLLLAAYTDVGTGFNQLLDVVVLTVLAVGHLAGRAVTSADPVGGRLVLLARRR